MIKITCGEAVTDEEYRGLTQPERKRLGQLVREMRSRDKLTPESELLSRAYHQVLAESVAEYF